MAGPERSQASYAAMGGVLAAGSLAVLWLACAAPSGRIGLTAAAGLFPVAAALYAGRGAGYLCWASSALLGLFLLPDKGVAALYLAFLGVYPVAKGSLTNSVSPSKNWTSSNFVKPIFLYSFRTAHTLVQNDIPCPVTDKYVKAGHPPGSKITFLTV